MKLSILSGLGVLFIGLKLFGIIGWSWWLVTMPLWLLVIVVLVLVLRESPTSRR